MKHKTRQRFLFVSVTNTNKKLSNEKSRNKTETFGKQKPVITKKQMTNEYFFVR